MRRPAPAALLVLFITLLIAACAGGGAAASPSAAPTTQASPSAEPTASASEDPESEPEPSASEAPTWTGHPAEGLALVRPMSETDPTSQVFIVEADGSLRQVTGLSNALGASHPVWSPDGEQLAFGGPKIGESTIRGQLGVVNADGTGERQVGEGAFPQWSPDGTMIAFNEVDDVTGEDLSFYVVDVATVETTDLGLGYAPRWLDAGRLFVNANSYAADGVATSSLYVLDLASGEREHVADWTTGHPAPDGAGYLLQNEEDQTITLVGPDGSAEEIATGYGSVWSPDGTRVAVAYDIDQDANPIYAIVDLDGNELASGIVGSGLTWSPDGSRVALEVYRPDMPVVQVVEIASGEVVFETEGMQPAWRP